jgi:hypothetical protein
MSHSICFYIHLFLKILDNLIALCCGGTNSLHYNASAMCKPQLCSQQCRLFFFFFFFFSFFFFFFFFFFFVIGAILLLRFFYSGLAAPLFSAPPPYFFSAYICRLVVATTWLLYFTPRAHTIEAVFFFLACASPTAFYSSALSKSPSSQPLPPSHRHTAPFS